MFKVSHHVRRKKTCACCDVIVRVGHRQLKIADPGPDAELDCWTMIRWVGACGALARPLGDALQRYVLMLDKIHSDNTPMLALDREMTKPRLGRLHHQNYCHADVNDGTVVTLTHLRLSPDSQSPVNSCRQAPPLIG